MLSRSLLYPTIPASDLERAGRFYEDKLGLKKVDDAPADGGLIFQAGDCTRVLVYKSEAKRGEATAAFFLVDDLDSEMKALRDNGIAFEDYDMPGLHTEDGVLAADGMKAAWFKDTEGNILSLTEMPLPK